MLDDELKTRGLGALLIASAVLLQEAHDQAVRRLPESGEGRVRQTAELSARVSKIAVLLAACEVLSEGEVTAE